MRNKLAAVIARALARLLMVLAHSAAFLMPNVAWTDDRPTESSATQRQAPRHHTSLDDRVKALTRALDLDAKQQSELRKVLEGQREQVMRVWSDTSVPAAYRVSATQTISDQTADQIRALLNEEQRKKYNPPRPPHEATAGSARPSVEDWMGTAKPK